MATMEAREQRVNVNAVRAPDWISSELRELDRLRTMPERRERSLAFEALYHSYRKRCGMTYEADVAARYENRDLTPAIGGLYERF